jgi:hypothetical protein
MRRPRHDHGLVTSPDSGKEEDLGTAREESAAVHRQIAVGVRNPGEATAALEFALEEAALRGASLLAVHAWHRLPGVREVRDTEEPPGRHPGPGGEPPGIGAVQHAVLNHAHGPIAVIPSSV